MLGETPRGQIFGGPALYVERRSISTSHDNIGRFSCFTSTWCI